jgi:uncharacterized protein
MTDLDDAVQAIKDADVARIRKLLEGNPLLAAMRTSEGLSVLTTAAYYGREEIVRLLLATDPPLDIFEASTVGDTERVEELADAGADVDGKSPDGFTALHLAAFFGHIATARALLQRGAPVDVVSTNYLRVRPLNSAAAGQHVEIVRMLLERGADPDDPEGAGFTPLHAAAENGDIDSARLLLDAGADATRKAGDGRIPADFARARGHEDLVALLSEAHGPTLGAQDSARNAPINNPTN